MTDNLIATALRAALDNKPGWRAEARRVLGLDVPKRCEHCGKEFPSGGKQRLTCSRECSVRRAAHRQNGGQTANLAFRFLKLKLSQRREILDRLALVTEQDRRLPEMEQVERAFSVARKRGAARELAIAVTLAEKAG